MDVIIEEGPIGLLTIDRADRRNALTIETTMQIAAGITKLAASSRVIILTGAGSAFCAGGDFDELKRMAGKPAKEAADMLYSGFQSMILAIRRVDIPVIAAINGHAMGAGMDLALACDLRVASRSAKLGQVWVKVGIIPGTGGAFWVSLLAGAGRAAQMILSGEPIDATTALEWGLVNDVVDPHAVVGRARELANEIAKNPPGAVAA
ncbi:MAG TPA: enoyl-CoA hydratase/isomerase family protein, partial [Actinomycetota bacterium]|nr:enoyl-CoA hydratase/isomerase family protein [Actinomycetota bacterium]